MACVPKENTLSTYIHCPQLVNVADRTHNLSIWDSFENYCTQLYKPTAKNKFIYYFKVYSEHPQDHL